MFTGGADVFISTRKLLSFDTRGVYDLPGRFVNYRGTCTGT